MGIGQNDVIFINEGQEDQMRIAGYRQVRAKVILSWILTVLTVGLLQLLFYWKPDWMVEFTCCPTSLSDAQFVILKDQFHQVFVEKIKYLTTSTAVSSQWSSATVEQSQPVLNKDDGATRELKYFTNKKVQYFWNPSNGRFWKLCGLEEGLSCSFFHEHPGLSEATQIERQKVFGKNVIIVHVTPIIKLLFTQAVHPFYVFQLFSCALWFSDQYIWYASCILIISALSLTAQIYQTRSMQRSLKSTLTPVEMVSVCRGDTGEFVTIPSDSLVPGDVVEIPRNGCVMQCDAVLTAGNCIVNESMLTGESVPVMKTPIPNSSVSSKAPNSENLLFNVQEHSRHILFSGTQVIQTRFYGNQKVTAVVIRTGFATAKGELVRSILFPKPLDFKFSQDGAKFIGTLALIALGGMIYTIVLMVERGEGASHVIVRSLDLITIVIPPALPAAMTVGVVFAQKRLRERRVYCISANSINLCGAINVFCFDKTGTLTEDGLDLREIIPVRSKVFQKEEKSAELLDQRNPVLVAMTTCHSLTIIDGNIVGDPMDLKMFEATKWELEEPGEDTSKYDIIAPTIVHPKRLSTLQRGYEKLENLPYEIGIMRQFTFTSKLQRMSVITRQLGSNDFDLYMKGSPEMVSSLCNPSTVPPNFHDILMRYTVQGYRVIGLAHRRLNNVSYVKVQRCNREEMERELTFIGLIVFENRLKPETTPVINVLKDARIRTVMVTGDNMLTALSVARDCNMVGLTDKVALLTVISSDDGQPPRIEITLDTGKDNKKEVARIDIEYASNIHFAITGKSWSLLRRYFPDYISKLAVRGTVFARFLPEQKQQLIEALQDVGYYVGMCGDGANDCGALKTAHAGISLSEAEASVASPFTSKDPNIKCVPKLIKEGRAALVTSFGVFKYMAGYSLTQFLSVCLAYWIGANMTDFTFLYADLVLITSLGITFCYTRAYSVIDPRPPKISLLSAAPILSIICALLINLAAQVFTFLWIQQQPWFEPFEENDDYDYQCYEVTILFTASAFQFIIMAVVFAKGAPYRKPMLTNYAFTINVLIAVSLTAYIVIYPMGWIVDLLELLLAPSVTYRLLIVAISAINFFVHYFVETFFIDALIENKLSRWWHNRYSVQNTAYRRIECEMTNHTEWLSANYKHEASIADLMRLENAAFVANDEDFSTNSSIEDVQLVTPTDINFNDISPGKYVSQMSVDSYSSTQPIFEPQPDYDEAEDRLLSSLRQSTTAL